MKRRGWLASSGLHAGAVGAALLLAGCGAPVDKLTLGEGTSARGVRIAGAALAGGLPQAALNATQNVLGRDPTNVDALLKQAEALTELGRDDAAAEAYRRVLAKDASPTREQARMARVGAGRADLAGGRGAQAEAIYAALAASNPTDPVGHSGLAIALDQQGRHAEAQAEYRKSLALVDTAATRSNLGLSLAMSGHTADALTMLRPLAGEGGSNPRIRHNLAFALQLAGNLEEAKRALAVDMPQDQVSAALAGFDAFRPVATAAARPAVVAAAPSIAAADRPGADVPTLQAAGPYITLSPVADGTAVAAAPVQRAGRTAAAQASTLSPASSQARVRARARPVPEIAVSSAPSTLPAAPVGDAAPSAALATFQAPATPDATAQDAKP